MYTEKEMAYWLDRIDGLGKKRLQKLREVLGMNTENTAARLYVHILLCRHIFKTWRLIISLRINLALIERIV